MQTFDSRPATVPIVAYYKGDFALRVRVKQNGEAYPLTGASGSFIVKEKRNGTIQVNNPLTIDEANGIIDIDITNAQIVDLATQEYDYECILNMPGGIVWPILDSVFEISEDGQSGTIEGDVSINIDGGEITVQVLTTAPGATSSSSITVTAGEDITSKDLICFGADGKAYKADINDIDKEAVAIAGADIATDDTGAAYLGGYFVTGMTGLTPGARHYLSTAGTVTATIPTAGYIQQIGHAISATDLVFFPLVSVFLGNSIPNNVRIIGADQYRVIGPNQYRITQ